jgi:hypothetical protein
LKLQELIHHLAIRLKPTRGEKMKDSFAMLLKTNGGKMSLLRSIAMLLKIRELNAYSRHFDEKQRG